MVYVQIGLLAALGIVVSRIGFVQSAFGPGLLAKAAKVEDNSHVVLAQRGSILDTHGHTLAYDVPAYMLDIRTASFSNLTDLANALAPTLGSTESALLAKLKSGNGHWVRWPNPLLATQKDAILQAVQSKSLKTTDKTPTQDVTFTPTEQRYYPYGQFASNTIGFVNHSGLGVTGLEAQYNGVLSGSNGKINYTQDSGGFPIQSTIQTVKQAIPGSNLETTIDETIQGFVEQEMDQLNAQYKPEHAAIIVTDPSTGGVLAMSSRPTFDPNKYGDAPSATAIFNNWAVDASFEPGSTFKPITLAAALATHSILLNQTFQSGHTTIAGQTISDWNMVGWGTLTYLQALEKSSNVGFAKIALKVGWPNLLHYMQVFGYLHPSGIDLPGEADSQIFSQDSRHTIELATSGFGQGISVTPMQQMAAIGAIANGGKLIRPHLAKALVDPNTNKVIKDFPPVIENPQVVPKDVISELNHALVLDVNGKDGIDTLGKIPGYLVAGKTGTANTVDPKTGKYYSDRYIVSFIGYAPATHPKYEIYVTLDWPKTPIGEQWGSTVATPAAQKILQECLQYGHVPPDDPSTLAKSASVQKASVPVTMVTVPAVQGKTVKQAQGQLTKAGLQVVVAGQGLTVTKEWPAPGQTIAAGSKVFLYAPGDKPGAVSMPDLRGATLRDAMDIMSLLGVTVHSSGAGFVTTQSIPPGSSLAKGTTVGLTCAPPALGQDFSNSAGSANSQSADAGSTNTAG